MASSAGRGLWLLATLGLSCGRIGYGPTVSGGPDGAPPFGGASGTTDGGSGDSGIDAPIGGATGGNMGDGGLPPGGQAGTNTPNPDGGTQDATPLPRACIPFAGNWTLEAPTPVSELNDTGWDVEPFLAADGRTLLFSSLRGGGPGGFDVYQATRAAPGAAFMNIVEVSGLNSARDELGLRFTANGLIGFLSTNQGGMPNRPADIWVGTRAAVNVPWNIAQFSRSDTLSTDENNWDPFPSPDGLRIYYTIDQWPQGLGGKENVFASRSAVNQPFSTPMSIPGINSTFDDDNPAVTPDERVIVFGSDRPGGPGGRDLWYAVRARADLPFDAPQLLPVINTTAAEVEGAITGDCELFFSSDRQGGKGGLDIYRTRFIPAP